MLIRSSIIRSVLGIIAGLLIIMWPDQTVSYLIILTGTLFILSGGYAIILYLRDRKDSTPVYPVASAASILLGVWLVLAPLFFINILMYACGVLFVLAGVQQIIALVSARRWSTVPYGFYVLPVLISVTGAAILFHIAQMREYTLTILGVVSLLYGVNELISWYKFRKPKSKDAFSSPNTAEESTEYEILNTEK